MMQMHDPEKQVQVLSSEETETGRVPQKRTGWLSRFLRWIAAGAEKDRQRGGHCPS